MLGKWRCGQVKPPSAPKTERRYARSGDRYGAEKVGCSCKSYGVNAMARLPESGPGGPVLRIRRAVYMGRKRTGDWVNRSG